MNSNEISKIHPVSDNEKAEESSDKFEGGVEPELVKNEDELSEKVSAMACSPKVIKEKDLGSPVNIPEVNSPSSATKILTAANSPTTGQSNKSSVSRSFSRKSTIITEPAKEHKKSYVLAGMSCIAFGLANYFMSDLSIRCGNIGVFTECFGLFLSWALFHIYKYVAFRRNSKSVYPYFRVSNSPYYEEFLEDVDEDEENAVQVMPAEQPNSDKQNDDSLSIVSEIDDHGEVIEKPNRPNLTLQVKPITTKLAPIAHHIFTWQRFSAPLGRCLVQCAIQFAITACFFFAFQSGVNAGIISTIFSSSCVFTIIIFYFRYGHKISLVDAIGTGFILLCVVMIALGGAGGSSEEEVIKSEDQIKQEKLNLVLALIFALISGLTLSMNTVSIQYTIHTGFNLDQANYDGNAMLGVLFLPFFIYFRESYTFMDVCVGTLVILCVTTGVILFSRALSCGIAGPVQAIENSKTVVQTVMCIVFLGQIPNLMQILGLITGSIGVISIVLQKKKDVAAKEIDTSKK